MARKTKAAVYLTELTVQNVKSFADFQRLKLCDEDGHPSRWVLILGENGVGKTTLLECLALLTPVFNSKDSDGDPDPTLFVEPMVASADNDVIRRLGRDGDVEFEMRATFATAGRLDAGKQSDEQVVTGLAFTKRDGRIEEIKPIETHEYVPFIEPLVIAYGAGRFMGISNLDPASTPDATASLLQGKVELFDAAELIQQYDYAALRSRTKKAKKRLDDLLRVVSSLLPDVGRPENVKIYPPAAPGTTGKSGVYVKTRYGEVPLHALSFGYQTVAAWATDLAWRLFEHYPDSSNPLEEPAIVLVDEIDLHLHPRWQRDLRQRLTDYFPNIQFIVTAHSPLMAQAYLDANLAVVQPERDHAIIENDPHVVRSWRLDQVITSELFGLESPLAPEYERLLEEQRKLVGKRSRSPEEAARLEAIETHLLDLPLESEEDERAMDIIRRAAAKLEAGVGAA